MRIVCPSCNAAYDVPPERLAAGRSVKCARCATTWSPVAIEAPAAAPPPDPQGGAAPDPDGERAAAPVAGDAAPIQPDAVGPEAAEPQTPVAAPAEVPAPAEPPVQSPKLEPLAAPRPRRRSRAPLALAWLLSFAVLAGLGWAAIDRRAAIMAHWPPSIRAYAALGLAAPAGEAAITKP